MEAFFCFSDLGDGSSDEVRSGIWLYARRGILLGYTLAAYQLCSDALLMEFV